MNHITEVVLFRLKEEATEADFLKEAGVAQMWIEEQEGYISRELLKTPEGKWVDTVRWTDLASAEKAGVKLMETAHCQPFISMIDETTMQMMHCTPQAVPVG